MLTKDKRELIKSRNFKVSQVSDEPLSEPIVPNNNFVPQNLTNENSSCTEPDQTENLSEQSLEKSVQSSPEVENAVSEENNNKEHNNKNTVGTLLPEKQYLRRSTRVTKPPQRLTYADVVNGDTMFLFENVNLLFEQPNLIDFAAAVVKKDNLIPRNYFQINFKSSPEDWFRAHKKELTKLIDTGKMVLVPKN
eukprot:snap_masked-scaffold_26-processed-gene-4.50-mRNA-1 protein AED:1.00 eAED:1.00 QI:0/-1/0/0/-1/1/1/0/192